LEVLTREVYNDRVVTLISPPHYSLDKANRIYPPLNLAYIASYLEQNGYRVTIIDAIASGAKRIEKLSINNRTVYRVGLPYDEIMSRIPQKTSVIGISACFSPSLPIVKQLSGYIKNRFPGIKLVAGGAYASLLPEDVLDSRIDYVVRGEGEMAMLELASGKDPSGIRGIYFKKGSQVTGEGFADRVDDLDKMPFPAYHLLEMESYLSRPDSGRDAPIVSSRGCMFNCSFCTVPNVYGNAWKGRSAKNIISEIDELAGRYNAGYITFLDENFMNDMKRAEEIIDELTGFNKGAGKRKIRWTAWSGLRADRISDRFLEKLSASNCTLLCLPIESGDPRILDSINKPLDLDRIFDIVKKCRRLKINLKANLIVGYPGETRESFNKTMRYFLRLKKAGLNNVVVSTLKVYPRTKIYDYCVKHRLKFHDIKDHTFFLREMNILRRREAGLVTEDFGSKEVIRRQNYAFVRLNWERYCRKMFFDSILFKFIKRILPYRMKRRLKGLLADNRGVVVRDGD